MPYQIETEQDLEDIAWVRLLIADADEDASRRIFEDQELITFIKAAGGPLWGAADALDAIATSEVLLGKKITTQDLSTDGPAVAAELRKQAAGLRARAEKQASDEADEAAWGMSLFTLTRPPGAVEATERGWVW